MALVTPDTVFRRYVTAGVPDSGKHEPAKSEIIQLLNLLFGVSRGGWVVAKTRAELLGVVPDKETDGGVVLNDGTVAYNGYYQRDGGAWVWERGFPDTFAKVVLSGSGTAQTGALAAGVSPAGAEVFFARVTTPNTGPLTLSISGGAVRDVVNLAGNPLSAGEWTGVVMFFLNEDGDYQLLIDAGAAASAAASAASAAKSLADLLDRYLGAFEDDAAATAAAGTPTTGQLYFNTTDGKFRVYNGTTWQDQSTALSDGQVTPAKLDPTVPAEFRQVIEAVGFEDLPYVPAWEHGVPGDSSDQTAALQALIDAQPSTGATILIKGEVYVSALSFLNKRYTRLMGIGAMASSTTPSMLRLTATGAGDAVDYRGSIGCGLKGIYVRGMDASFTGNYIKLGIGAQEAVFFEMDDCTLFMPTGGSVSACGLDLDGSTQGVFSRVSFRGGPGRHITGRRGTAAANYSNLHTFRDCAFNPTNQVPVRYPGNWWKFESCNIQAGSSDGVGRFITGHADIQFEGLAVNNNTFFDVLDTVIGGQWLANLQGTGLEVCGNLFGGRPLQQAIHLWGTRGFRIMNNVMRGGAVLVSCATGTDLVNGTTGVKVAGGLIAGNLIHNQSLIGSVSNMDLAKVDIFGNYHTGTGTNTFNRATA